MSAQPIANEQPACLKWSGGSWPLTGPCVIGRRSDNDIPIPSVQVSRRHALLVSHQKDWWINDLGSRNGVFVNGLRITSARRLRDGDEIRISIQRLTFKNTVQVSSNRSAIVGNTTYYGWYSNKMRGQRRKRAEEAKETAANDSAATAQQGYGAQASAAVEIIEHLAIRPRRIPSQKWRDLIKKV